MQNTPVSCLFFYDTDRNEIELAEAFLHCAKTQARCSNVSSLESVFGIGPSEPNAKRHHGPRKENKVY